MQLALKLNEATFQPLFLRLIDWTTSGEIADAALSSTARKYTFFRVLDRLLIQLKVSKPPISL